MQLSARFNALLDGVETLGVAVPGDAVVAGTVDVLQEDIANAGFGTFHGKVSVTRVRGRWIVGVLANTTTLFADRNHDKTILLG